MSTDRMSDSVLGEGEDGLLSQLDELEIDISFDSPGNVTPNHRNDKKNAYFSFYVKMAIFFNFW